MSSYAFCPGIPQVCLQAGWEAHAHGDRGEAAQGVKLRGPVLLCSLPGFSKTCMGAAGGLPHTDFNTKPGLGMKCLQT